MLKVILAGLIFLPAYFAAGQTTLSGRVADANTGEGLPSINILISNKGQAALVAFAITDNKGNYSTTFASSADSLVVEASSINYRNRRITVANTTQTLEIFLQFEVKDLKEFTVTGHSIERRGDTLSYAVRSFARPQDRSIAEVLRRMPGVDVESSGRILYQGEPIQKFYVEGLDLMGGRYGMVSNNLPHQSVAAVEVLENHQPLRVLQDRAPSTRASLNLKLAQNVATTGTARLGSGLWPILFTANVTPMTFTRNFQVVNSYQGNNIGQEVGSQLQQLTIQDMEQRLIRTRQNPQMLSIQTMAEPTFNQTRVLDNLSHLVSSNALLKLDKDWQLRANISYLNHGHEQSGSQTISYYLPTGDLVLAEAIQNHLKDHYMQGEVNLNRNARNNYLDNKTRFEARWDHRRGEINSNLANKGQDLSNPYSNFSNSLRTVIAIGSRLVEFTSDVTYNQSPHTLLAHPGGFEQALNQGNHIDSLRQSLNIQKFSVSHTASFSFLWNRITFTPKVGHSVRYQSMGSDLEVFDGSRWTSPGLEYSNNLEANHHEAFAETGLHYKRGQLTLTGHLPIRWQRAHLHDGKIGEGQTLAKLTVNPRAGFAYQFKGFWRLIGSYRYMQNIGDIDNVHYGYLLRNINSLARNGAPLSQTSSHTVSIFVQYRNPIIAFFNHANTAYTVTNNNLMYSTEIKPDGTSIVEALELPNTSYNHFVYAETSKYFHQIKSTLKLSANYMRSNRKSLINGQLRPFTSTMLMLTPQASVRVSQAIFAEYRANFSNSKSYSDDNPVGTISLWRHFFDLTLLSRHRHFFMLTTEYYHLHQKQNFFLDFRYRYRFEKARIDLEVNWRNIFNTAKYTTFSQSDIMLLETIYKLRPSEIFVTLGFRF